MRDEKIANQLESLTIDFERERKHFSNAHYIFLLVYVNTVAGGYDVGGGVRFS